MPESDVISVPHDIGPYMANLSAALGWHKQERPPKMNPATLLDGGGGGLDHSHDPKNMAIIR